MPKKRFYLLMMVLAFLICDGCSKDNRPKDLPRLYPVTLSIMSDDQPIGKALVFLYAEDKAIANWTVSGVTEADGNAIIVTHGQFRGAPEGKFKVCVKKVEPALGPGGKPQVIHHVDPKFGEPETTPLEAEITPRKKMTNLTFHVNKPR